MEQEKLQIDWIGVFTQWILLFILLTIIFLPGFKFRNLAKKYGEKGWPYFVIGIGIALPGLALTKLMGLFLDYYSATKLFRIFSFLALIISWYGLYRFAYKFLERNFRSKLNGLTPGNSDKADILESETLDEHLRKHERR